MGKKYGTVSFLQILAPELNDRLLADFLDMESSLIVSMHIQSEMCIRDSAVCVSFFQKSMKLPDTLISNTQLMQKSEIPVMWKHFCLPD